MILLAIDTSGKDGGIALARAREDAEPHAVEIMDLIPLEGGTFSAQLVPQVAGLLAKHGFTKNDIGAFAVASGPGSFTGLRVGLAAVKAMAEILEKPIAAVSRLEAVARLGPANGRLVAALDAGRGEVYAGEYEAGDGVRMLGERLLSLDELFEAAGSAIAVTPEVKIAEGAHDRGLMVELVAHPTSEQVARFGWEKIRQGCTISPEQLDANYIRRSDAEIFAKT